MTGRVDLLWRIFEKSAKKVKNEVTGLEIHNVFGNFVFHEMFCCSNFDNLSFFFFFFLVEKFNIFANYKAIIIIFSMNFPIVPINLKVL